MTYRRATTGTPIPGQRASQVPQAQDDGQRARQTERLRAEIAALRVRDSVVLEPDDDLGAAIATIGRTGGVIILTEGTWQILGTIPVPIAGVKIFGVTPERCLLRKDVVDANPIFSVTAARFEIHGLGVWDEGSTGSAAVSLQAGADHFVMDRCYINTCYRAVLASSAHYGQVSNCKAGARAEAVRLVNSDFWTIGPNSYLTATDEIIYADDDTSWLIALGNQGLGVGEISVKAGTSYQLAANAAIQTVRP